MSGTQEKHTVSAKTVSFVGGGLALVSLLIGVIPVRAGGGNCGSVLFSAVGEPHVRSGEVVFLTPPGCDSLLSIMKVPMIVLIVIGGLLTFYGLVQSMRQRLRDRDSA